MYNSKIIEPRVRFKSTGTNYKIILKLEVVPQKKTVVLQFQPKNSSIIFLSLVKIMGHNYILKNHFVFFHFVIYIIKLSSFKTIKVLLHCM